MPDQTRQQLQDGFARLHAAIVADVKQHVSALRQSCVEFYGYALLPPDYYTTFDPTTLAVAFNRESDIDANKRGEAYYRYSVDEWQNYVHEGFDAVNRELKSLLQATRPSCDDPIEEAFVNSVYQVILDAMLTLRNEDVFDSVPYLIIWLSDSGDGVMSRSAKLLNPPDVYREFVSEFGE